MAKTAWPKPERRKHIGARISRLDGAPKVTGAAKYAYDKAAAKGGKFPSTEQVVAALEGATITAFSTTIQMALNNGHQAITDHV